MPAWWIQTEQAGRKPWRHGDDFHGIATLIVDKTGSLIESQPAYHEAITTSG